MLELQSSAPTITELKLGEVNELCFKVSIQGTISESLRNSSADVFRFTITDPETKMGYIFPCERQSFDTIQVLIPKNHGLFTPDKHYTGKLEVVVESLYFNPVNLILEFVSSVQVEASLVSNTQKGMEMDRSLVSEAEAEEESNLVAQVTTPPVPPPVSAPPQNSKTLQGSTGTKATANPGEKSPGPQTAPQGQQQAPQKAPVANKAPAAPKQSVPPPNPLINEQKKKELLKKKLLGMMREALLTSSNDGPAQGNSRVT